MRNRNTMFTAILLACVGCLPIARAVVPPPDGGYPNFNTAEGTKALFSLTTGLANTAVGWFSLFSNTDGSYNTAVGAGTLIFNIGNQSTGEGTQNTAIGTAALLSNTTGNSNTAIGTAALLSNTTGNSNTANGAGALFSTTTSGSNTANGYRALYSNTEGDANTAAGGYALFSNTMGGSNTAIGASTLFNNTTGFHNTALGANTGNNVTTANNVIAIHSPAANVSNSCYIGNIWDQPGGPQTVYVSSEGKLGYAVSSRRFKDEIKPMADASEAIYYLNPVTFRYKKEIEPTRPLGFGLVAEDVEKVSPDLVAQGGDGKANSVRYDAVNAMLLNEFLKEHKKGEQQGRKIEELEATVARLESVLKEQAAEIQKVCAELEVSRSASRLVNNDH